MFRSSFLHIFIPKDHVAENLLRWYHERKMSEGCQAEDQVGERTRSNTNDVHEVFGDVNLGGAMLFLVLLQMMQYAMQGPCTC